MISKNLDKASIRQNDIQEYRKNFLHNYLIKEFF